MEEWKYIKISELCEKVCSGGTPKSTISAYYGGNIPWLNTKEIDFNRIYKTEKNITQEGLDNSSAKWIEENSVIVAMYGATAGKCAISKIPLTTNQACCNLMIDKTVADYRYVYYALYNDYVKLSSLANGGAQQNLNAQQIKDFNVPYRELKEQKIIANLLSSLDGKIALNKRINDNLEQQAQALYKSWFVDFKPFKDGGFIDSELGEIPEGWKILPFVDFLILSNRKTEFDNIPEYSVTNTGIFPREEKFNKKLSSSTSKNKLINRNDLVFGMSREILNWGIMEDDIGGVSSAYTVYNIDYNIINPIYLKLFIQSRIGRFKDLIRPAAREGQGIDKQRLMSKYIYLPTSEILNNFWRVYDKLMESKENFTQETQNLTQVRDSLLPKLMSGELKINDLHS